MSPIGDTPANEAQARPLTRIRTIKGALDKKAISRVWQKVVDVAPVDESGRKVITAKIVEEAVRPTLRKRAKHRSSSSESVVESTPGLASASPVDAIVARKVEQVQANANPPTKENITHEQFLELHGLVLWLKKLTGVPSMQLSPIHLRNCAERIGRIVLE